MRACQCRACVDSAPNDPRRRRLVAELCDESELDVAAATRAGLEELGRRFAAASPDSAVALTPPNVHVESSLAVIVGSRVEGSLDDERGREISLSRPVDVELAEDLLTAVGKARIPATAVSDGGNRACGRWTEKR